MSKLNLEQNAAAVIKLQSYPTNIRLKLSRLRSLILETAKEIEEVEELEETLKWGELSYLAKKGSTIRMDWKPKSPHQYALYFKCTSKLVPTFKELFGNTLTFEDNRAIVFQMDEVIPEKEVKECIRMALSYHSLKNLPLLGQ